MSVVLIPVERNPYFPPESRFPFSLISTSTAQLVVVTPPLAGAGDIVPPVTVVGGNQGLRIFIAGTDVSNYAGIGRLLVFGNGQSAQQVRIQSQTIGRWTANFDIYDPDNSYTPQLGQTVQLLEAGLKLFSGCIDSLQPELIDGTASGPFSSPVVIYHVTAVDKSSILDHRIVLAPIFTAGTDGASVINTMWTDSAACNPPISVEGIGLAGVPASLGAISADMVLNLPTVRQVLDNMATDLGGVWWIDPTGNLNFQLLPDLGSCPFSLSMASKNFRKASMTTSLLEYATKDYALSDRAVTPGSSGVAGVLTTETYTLPQAAAAARGFLYDAIITNYPISSIYSLKVNGVVQPTYLGTVTPFINFRHTWWYFAGTPYLTGPNAQNQNPFPDPAVTSPDPSAGDTIEIKYFTPATNSQVKQTDPLAPTAGTCGSGIYEVVEQAKGITTQSDLNAIAAAALTRRSQIPKTLQFETDVPGAVVGQKISVDLPRLDLASTSLLITTIDGTAISAGPLAYGSRFRWTITATNTQDLGNYIKWFERLVARTENAIPVPRYDTAQFVLAPGGSLSAGVATTNPLIVANTGQVILAYAQATTPPTGQSMTITFISAALGNIATVTIGDSDTTLEQTTTTTASPAPLWLYAGDNITVSITYNVTSSNPVPAANVTAGLRIAY